MFSKNTQQHVFMALTLNISHKIHFFFGEKNLVALDTYAKKMNPLSIVLVWGGVHGKTLVKLFKNGKKNYGLNLNYGHQCKIVLFDIILHMLLDETF